MRGPRAYSASELGNSTQNVALAFSLYIAGQKWGDEDAAAREKRIMIPLVNTYYADLLLNLGHGHGSGDVEEIAKRVMAEGQKGDVEYAFALDKDLGPNTQAFNEYQKLTVASPDKSAGNIVAEIIQRHATGQLTLGMALSAATGVVVKRWRDEIKLWKEKKAFAVQTQRQTIKNFDAREAAQKAFLTGDFYPFAAVLMDARPIFLNLWQRYPPTIRLSRGGRPSMRDGEARNSKGQLVPAKVATHSGFVTYTGNASNEMRKDLGVKEK